MKKLLFVLMTLCAVMNVLAQTILVGEQPYDVFLDGVIKCAYCYAFNVELEDTLH